MAKVKIKVKNVENDQRKITIKMVGINLNELIAVSNALSDEIRKMIKEDEQND